MQFSIPHFLNLQYFSEMFYFLFQFLLNNHMQIVKARHKYADWIQGFMFRILFSPLIMEQILGNGCQHSKASKKCIVSNCKVKMLIKNGWILLGGDFSTLKLHCTLAKIVKWGYISELFLPPYCIH